MNFELTPEQRLLKDSVDRVVADHYTFDQRKAYAEAPGGWSREQWARYAELGLLGLPFDEADGGHGGGAVETMLVMEALGCALALEPYLACVVLGGGLLRHAANATLRQALVPRITDGTLTLAFAHSERQSRYDLASVATTARRDGEAWVLNGEKSLVLHGDSADRLIVSARVAGSERDRDGVALFIVDGQADGVARIGYPTQDGLRAAEVRLCDVDVGTDCVLGEPGAALPVIERVVDEAIAAICAEAVGAMEQAYRLTVQYLNTRRQFGVPISSFQVLRHQVADMLIALEEARSLSLFATLTVGESDAASRRRAASAAKVQIGWSAKSIGQKSIQLHGGIGMTNEYSLGHYFKRLTMIEYLFGDTSHHLAELARLGGLFPEESSPRQPG